MNVVEAEGLKKHYHRRKGLHRNRQLALHGLDLQVGEGEIFGLLGHNGAGKTTTIKCLLGLMRPSAGRVRLLGAEMPASRVLKSVGYLPESPYFYQYLTCRELVTFYAALAGVPASQRSERVNSSLLRTGMLAAADMPLRKCSKGMLQRVGLAQAIVHGPQLLILDEPMSGLDPLGRREVRELILELRREGATILFSTHILSDAEQLCDRVAILRQGSLAAAGRMDEILQVSQSQFELTWRQEGSSPPLLSGARQLAASQFQVQVAASQLWQALHVLQGAELISVQPLRRSLEEVFVASTASPTSASQLQEAPQ